MSAKKPVYAFLVLLLVVLVGSLSATLAQDEELSGTLTVFLQTYYNPATNAETAQISEEIASEYESLHPGVDIQLVPDLPAGQDYETFLAARFSADEAPDIMWQQFATRNLRGDTWWVPLNEFFEMPNPYIEADIAGSERWADSFPDFVQAQTRAADGNWYQVSLDWVETGLYYNKDLFEQAGVDPESWTNWSDFITDMQTIRETTGADPLGMFMRQQGWSNWWWADDIMLTVAWADMADQFYMEKYNDPNRPWRQLNPEEIAKAIIEGTLNAEDPRMDTYLQMSRDFVGLFPIDYAGIASLDDIDPLFFSGQVASVWTGTWKNKPFLEQIPFEYGITYLPPITADDAPGGQGTAYRVGGPSSAGQYGIAQSAAEGGRLNLAVDFLMFLSAPQNFGRIAESFGGFVPMVAGTEAGEVMQGFAEVAALPERLFSDPDNRLTIESGDAWSQAMQAYFLGSADEAATKARLQEIWEEGAAAVCAAQEYDWCPT